MKRQLEIQNEQIRLNLFQDYTNRVIQLFWRLPENIYEDSFSFDDLEPEKRTEVMKTQRMPFNISSEWHVLYENHFPMIALEGVPSLQIRCLEIVPSASYPEGAGVGLCGNVEADAVDKDE